MARWVRQGWLACVMAMCVGMAQASEITVSAAASLGPAFKALVAAYQQAHAGERVALNLAASGVLLQQMAHGAPVDVVAFADELTMQQAIDKGLVAADQSRVFARNSLVLIAPKGASPQKTWTAWLKSPQVKRVAVGREATVPAGRYAKQALQTAGMWEALQPKLIPTQNVRQALDYMVRGEADAGFVYHTDALSAGAEVALVSEVATVEPIRYVMAVTAFGRQSAQSGAAQRFMAYVLSPWGQAILSEHGFRMP